MSDEALRKAARELVSPGSPVHVALWDAINHLVEVSGGRNTVSTARMTAVTKVETALRAALSAPTPEPSEAVTQELEYPRILGAETMPDELYVPVDCVEEIEQAIRSRSDAHAAGRAAAGKDAEDARRYRWLRRKFCLTGNGNGTCAMDALNLPANIQGWPEPGAENVTAFCDAAIDRAMSEKEPAK